MSSDEPNTDEQACTRGRVPSAGQFPRIDVNRGRSVRVAGKVLSTVSHAGPGSRGAAAVARGSHDVSAIGTPHRVRHGHASGPLVVPPPAFDIRLVARPDIARVGEAQLVARAGAALCG